MTTQCEVVIISAKESATALRWPTEAVGRPNALTLTTALNPVPALGSLQPLSSAEYCILEPDRGVGMSRRLYVPFDVFAMQEDVSVSTLVRDGNLGWTCGQCPLDREGNVVAPNDLVSQAR